MARPLRDPIAESIEGLSQAITGDRPQWQQNVTQTAERLTSSVADAVVERVTAPLTNAIRRTVSSSRTAPANVTINQPAVINSGNVTPGATFRRFEGDVPDLNNPPRFTPQTQTGSGGRPPLPPWWETADLPTVDERQQSTADRAAERAEEARRIVEDIACGGGRIPPAPPGGNDPPGPPDEPEDDDGILRQLLEFFQRMFGVRPDIANRNFLDTLANNLTSILGGVPAQAGADGQRPSSVATLMDTFADYFNVPRETEDATRAAQETLRRSIDRLTKATNGAANGGTPSQPQTRWQRFRGFFRWQRFRGFFRRGRTRRGGIATATRIAARARPLLNGIANILPYRWRMGAARFGQNAIGGIAQRFGVPAATAARFGAAIGPAALGIGIVAKAIPIAGAAIMAIGKVTSEFINSLRKMSNTALQTTISLAEYSAGLSHGNAALEYGRILRKINLAQGNEALGGFHLRQRNRFENAIAPWEQMATNAGSLTGGIIDSGMAVVVEHLNTLIGYTMKIHATILEKIIPGDQGEAALFAAAEKLLNPEKAGDNPPWAEFQKLLGANNPDQLDMARRMNNKPRQPGGVGK